MNKNLKAWTNREAITTKLQITKDRLWKDKSYQSILINEDHFKQPRLKEPETTNQSQCGSFGTKGKE